MLKPPLNHFGGDWRFDAITIKKVKSDSGYERLQQAGRGLCQWEGSHRVDWRDQFSVKINLIYWCNDSFFFFLTFRYFKENKTKQNERTELFVQNFLQFILRPQLYSFKFSKLRIQQPTKLQQIVPYNVISFIVKEMLFVANKRL